MKMRSAFVAAGLTGLVALGGAGVAMASTPAPAPAAASASAHGVDTPEPGDTPDTPGQADTHQDTHQPGQVDTPEPGDTPDAPGQQQQ